MKKIFTAVLLACALGASAWNPQNWMSELNGDIQMSNVSMPGAHDSSTNPNNGLGQVQTLTLKEQFAAGVRAFDIRVNGSSGLPLKHGITNSGISFTEAMTALLECVTENPTETAFIEMQLEGGNENTFKTEVASALQQLGEERFVRWHAAITLDECRGKVLLISRTKYNGFNGHGDTYWGYIDWATDNQAVANHRIYGSDNTNAIISDYYNTSDLDTKKNAIAQYAGRIVEKGDSEWGICFASGYKALIATTNDYATNAAGVNPFIIDMLGQLEKPIPLGIIYVDFAGVDKFNSYDVMCKTLGDMIIDNCIAYSKTLDVEKDYSHFIDYKPLQYIENTGAAVRENAFTTDYIPTTPTTIGVGFRGYESGEWRAIFCARNREAGTGISLYKNSDNRHLAFFTGSTTGAGDGFMEVYSHNNDYDVVANVKELKVTYNGKTVTKSTGNTSTNATTRRLSFFANPEWDQPFIGRIYYFNISDNDINDEYLPAMRKDGVWGYWNQKTGDASKFVTPAQGNYKGYNFKGLSGKTYITSQPVVEASAGVPTNLEPIVNGPIPETLVYTTTNSKVSISGTTVTATLAGTYIIYLEATDADGFTWKVPVTLNVRDNSASQYAEVDYIYYDGVNTDNWDNKSYFDTKIFAKAGTEIDLQCKIYDKSKGRWTAIFSGRTAFNNGMSLYQNNNGNDPQFGYFVSDNTNDFAGRLTHNTDYTIKFTKDQLVANGEVKATKNGITDGNFRTSDQTITLFGGRNDWPFFGEISYFKITENGNVLCEYVPVVSHDYSTFGFLNKVTGQLVKPNKYDGLFYGIKADTDKPLVILDNTGVKVYMTMTAQIEGIKFLNLNASDYTITYAALDENIASVNAEGLVTAKAEGLTDVIIMVQKGDEVWRLTANVEVMPVPTSMLTDLIEQVEKETVLLNLPYLANALAEAKSVASNNPTSAQIVAQIEALQGAYDSVKGSEKNIGYYLETRALVREQSPSTSIERAEALYAAAKNSDEVFAALKDLRYIRRGINVQRHNTEFVGSPVAEGNFFIYNIGQRQFLTSGSDFGTHAALNFRGRMIELRKDQAVEDAYFIYTPNMEGTNGMTATGYMDGPADAFHFVPVEGKENVYNIIQVADQQGYMMWSPYGFSDGMNEHRDVYGVEYWTQDETHVATREHGDLANNPDAQWMLVTEAERAALIDPTIASNSNPVDATILIGNAAFNKKTTENPWRYDNCGYWDGGGRNSEFGVESYNSTNFELSQVLKLIPGEYTLSTFAFYRNGTHGEQGTMPEVSKAFLFAITPEGEVSTLVPNIMEYADLAPGEGGITYDSNGVGHEIPGNVNCLHIWSRYGYYLTSIDFKIDGEAVTRDADNLTDVTIGVAKDEKASDKDDWTVISNFTLTYRGYGDFVGVEEVAQPEEFDGPTYNLQGIRIDAPTAPGIYIRNGRKFMVK